MKILDLTITGSSCQMGIVNRDSIPLQELPRMTENIFMGPANRCADACDVTQDLNVCKSIWLSEAAALVLCQQALQAALFKQRAHAFSLFKHEPDIS